VRLAGPRLNFECQSQCHDVIAEQAVEAVTAGLRRATRWCWRKVNVTVATGSIAGAILACDPALATRGRDLPCSRRFPPSWTIEELLCRLRIAH